MKTVALGEVVSINPRGDVVPRDEQVSFVGMAQLDPVSAVARPLRSQSLAEISSGYTVFRDGDVLAAKITPCWENHKVGQAKLDHRIGVGSTEFHVLRPGPTVDDRYLLHFLRQPSVRIAGELRMTGSAGQRRVPVAFFEALQIPVPPIDEQRRVAAILDQADAIRAKRRQVVAHLDALTQSIFYDMFGPPDGWTGRWPMGVIGDLAESVQYGTSAKAGDSGEWPIVRMGNVTDSGRLDLSDMKYLDLPASDVPKYTLQRGDLVFNRTNSKEKVGKAAVVNTDQPLALAGYLVRVRMKPEHQPEFVSAYLGSPHGRAIRRRLAKEAVNQANINASEMRRIPIAIPPTDLQSRFAASVVMINARRQAVEDALATDDELFASLQSRAFRGEL